MSDAEERRRSEKNLFQIAQQPLEEPDYYHLPVPTYLDPWPETSAENEKGVGDQTLQRANRISQKI